MSYKQALRLIRLHPDGKYDEHYFAARERVYLKLEARRREALALSCKSMYVDAYVRLATLTGVSKDWLRILRKEAAVSYTKMQEIWDRSISRSV